MSDRTETFERVLRLEPGRTALLVVDMQRGFLDPGAAMEVPEARAIVPTVAGLVALFRQKGLPVAFSQFVYSAAVPLLVGDLHPEHTSAAAPRDHEGDHRQAARAIVEREHVVRREVSGVRQVVIYPGEDGYWVAECPSLPGCVSQGANREEVIANIREAIRGYVAALEADNLSVPAERFETLVVAV
jgi:predicted RNase H-like HicB family nuclease